MTFFGSSFRWSADGEWIYFLYEFEGGTRLARVRVSDDKVEPLLGGDVNVSALDVARGGDIVVRAEQANGATEL